MDHCVHSTVQAVDPTTYKHWYTYLYLSIYLLNAHFSETLKDLYFQNIFLMKILMKRLKVFFVILSFYNLFFGIKSCAEALALNVRVQ